MWKLLLVTLIYGHSVQVCELDGVITYTDRNDVCADGEEFPLGEGEGTFSMVDHWDVVMPEPLPRPEPPERVIVEHHYYPVSPEEEPVHTVYGHLPLFPHQRFGGPRKARHERPREDDVASRPPERRARVLIPGNRRGQTVSQGIRNRPAPGPATELRGRSPGHASALQVPN